MFVFGDSIFNNNFLEGEQKKKKPIQSKGLIIKQL